MEIQAARAPAAHKKALRLALVGKICDDKGLQKTRDLSPDARVSFCKESSRFES
jgi:hypothetical protein